MRMGLICVCLFCLGSSLAYVVGRGERMRAETGGRCCFTSEGYVLWNGLRSIATGVDPYSGEVSLQNEIYLYGSSAGPRGLEPQRFAYPMYTVLPLLPIGWLGFQAASRVLLVVFGVLLAYWVGWLRGRWDRRTLLYTILIFATYPVLYDFVSLQPTVLALALVIAGLALLRSRQFAWAAVAVAVSMIKPQIAFPVLLPILVAAVGSKDYRRFIAWLAAAGVTLALLAGMLRHGWIAAWLSAARDYARYSPHSMASGWFGSAAPAISGIVALSLIAVLWITRHSDLLFRASLSMVVLYPLLPYRSYNAAVFMVPVIWLADNAARVKANGGLHELALGFTRVAVAALWVFTAVGAALLWSASWQVGFMLPILGLHVLFFSLCAVMLMQCGSELRGRRARPAVANAASLENSYSDLPNSTATLSE